MIAAESVALPREHDLELRVAERLVPRVSLGLFQLHVSVQRRHVIAKDRDRRFEEIVDGAEPALARALLDERVGRGSSAIVMGSRWRPGLRVRGMCMAHSRGITGQLF